MKVEIKKETDADVISLIPENEKETKQLFTLGPIYNNIVMGIGPDNGIVIVCRVS